MKKARKNRNSAVVGFHLKCTALLKPSAEEYRAVFLYTLVLGLERVWDAVTVRWQKLNRPTDRPLWDATTLAIAHAVARGEMVCELELPQDIKDKALAVTPNCLVP